MAEPTDRVAVGLARAYLRMVAELERQKQEAAVNSENGASPEEAAHDEQ